MKAQLVLAVLSGLVLFASATVYFSEDFGEGWEKRWVESSPKKPEEMGKWTVSAGKYFGDEAAEKGLKTTQDARFYDISAKADAPFSSKDKTLVIQYSVKHEQSIDCGGGYIKLLPYDTDLSKFGPDSPYYIMFGPDICGSTRKVHLIFTYKGQNYLLKKNVPCEGDTDTHLYTAIINPDNTYEILIDEKSVAKGSLIEDWDMLPPKRIPDPAAKKPADWVDAKEIPDPEDKKPEGWDDIPANVDYPNSKKPADWVDAKEIPDPEDKKPEGWDDIPATIADPAAKKPEDWDDELDGEWEAPQIDNPEYKGEWKPKMIPNPAYKGEWIHPEIDNPDFADDPNLYAYDNIGVVGFELWQVKAGTIFDNIVVTDSLDEAKEWAKKTVAAREGEKVARESELARERAAEPQDEAEEEEEDEHAGHDHSHDDL